MVYGGGGDSNSDGRVRGSGVGYDPWAEKTNPVLDLVSDSYSDSDIFLCIC